MLPCSCRHHVARRGTAPGICQIWCGLVCLPSFLPSLPPFLPSSLPLSLLSSLPPSSHFLPLLTSFFPSFLPPFWHCNKHWDIKMHLRHRLLLSSLVKEKRKSEREIIKFHCFQPLLLGSWELSQLILTKSLCGRGCYWQLVVKWIWGVMQHILDYSDYSAIKIDQANSMSKLYSLYLRRAHSHKSS